MAPRLELQTELEALTAHVYFQPPTNIQLQFPCIIYRRDSARTEFADNKPHIYVMRYEVTVIDRNPDSVLPGLVAALQTCVFVRHFTADDLNHDVFNLYF